MVAGAARFQVGGAIAFEAGPVDDAGDWAGDEMDGITEAEFSAFSFAAADAGDFNAGHGFISRRRRSAALP